MLSLDAKEGANHKSSQIEMSIVNIFNEFIRLFFIFFLVFFAVEQFLLH